LYAAVRRFVLGEGRSKVTAYSQGQGVEKNEIEAAKWCERAAELNHTEAQYCIAHRYSVGHGVPVDLVKAYKWMGLAAKSGLKGAQAKIDLLARSMTPEQIAAARQLIEEWKTRSN
jgi:TPR repeat protein